MTERMYADIGRICVDNGQEMHKQRKRAVSVLSPLCQCALTATETLRRERMCANSGGYKQRQRSGNAQTVMRTEGTPWLHLLWHVPPLTDEQRN